MRSLILCLILGLAALGTLGTPSSADAQHWQGNNGPGRYWQGGTHYRWNGGTHYRWNGGTHYYNPGYYNPSYYNSGYYNNYSAPSFVYPPPVYRYSPGPVIYYNRGYQRYYP